MFRVLVFFKNNNKHFLLFPHPLLNKNMVFVENFVVLEIVDFCNLGILKIAKLQNIYFLSNIEI